METQKLITTAAIRRHFGNISGMTVWRWVRKGLLPAPIKINGRNYWREADVCVLAEGRQAAERERAA